MCQGSATGRHPLQEKQIAEELVRLGRLLAARQFRQTASRRAIYEVMLRTNDHTCVEHILQAIETSYPSLRLNKTTVYRTLELYIELGLVTMMHHADGRTQYELALHGPHGHLLCRACGHVQDIAPEELYAIQARLGKAHGFDVELMDQALIGLCTACAHASQ